MSITATQSSTQSDAASALSSASSNSSSSTSSATGSDALGEDSFLQLLTAQLQNQDPLDPTSDSDFVAELAQFSSVEQLTSANTTLQQLVVGQGAANQTADASLVGKSVLYDANSVALTQGTPTMLYADLSAQAANVTATITNAQGQTVRTIQVANQPSGQIQIAWDGLEDDGSQAPSGTYNVTITASDGSGNPVTVTQEAQSLVTGVSFQSGYPELVVNTGDIQLSNVNEIDLAS